MLLTLKKHKCRLLLSESLSHSVALAVMKIRLTGWWCTACPNCGPYPVFDFLESPPQCGHHCHQRTTAVLQWCLWSSVCHRSHAGVSEHSWRGSKHALKCVYPRHAEDGRSDLTGFKGRSLISRGNQHCPLYCLPTSYWGTTPQGIPI